MKFVCQVGRFLCFNLCLFTFFIHGATAPARGQGLLIVEASRSHSDTSHAVELLWKSDQPDTETSIRQHTTIPKYVSIPARRDSNPQY